MPILNPNYSTLNYEEVAAAIGLKVKHMPMLIGSFLEESTTILENLQDAIKTNENELIKLHTHSIKGSAGNLKFKEIYEMAKEMEQAAIDEDKTFDNQAYLNAIKDAIGTISI